MFIMPGPTLAVAIGDAYGVGHEFTAHPPHVKAELSYLDSAYLNTLAGTVSDDTTMTRVNAEMTLAILTTGFNPTVLDFANAYLNNHRKIDPRKGYSKGFQALLDDPAVENGHHLITRINGHGKKETNGGAMRASPFGLLPTVGKVISLARRQAECTHTGNGLLAAQAAALMAHHGIYRLGPKAELPAFLAANLSRWHPEFNRPWSGYVECHGLQTVMAALTAIQQTDSFGDMLKQIVEWGGDVDSVCSVAMGAAWARTDMANDLPSEFFYKLEDSPFVRTYLQGLDLLLVRHAAKLGAFRPH